MLGAQLSKYITTFKIFHPCIERIIVVKLYLEKNCRKSMLKTPQKARKPNMCLSVENLGLKKAI